MIIGSPPKFHETRDNLILGGLINHYEAAA